ncbi:hypothetical protein HDV05_003306 [Chytridiales sp. JEL 0842]|nr:hypothetical protein HDV05_003306 [Chytridiales sp. JEL 0842]
MLFLASPTTLFSLILLSLSAHAQTTNSTFNPGVTGNCLTGTYPFDKDRMWVIPSGAIAPGAHYPPVLPDVDWSAYDWTVDYAPQNVNLDVGVEGGIGTRVTRAGFQGTRLSTTRYILYGVFTIPIKAIGEAGIITTFITMSDRGDEIDWEILNYKPRTPATTNIFWNRVLEFGVRFDEHALPRGTADGEFHDYTIDWNSERIIWSIDGTVIRTYRRSDSLKDGTYYYPSTPSLIQIGAWDGGDSDSPGLSAWAGGPVPWGSNTYLEALYGPLRVQCYDDRNRPVEMWPVQGNKGRSNSTSHPPVTTVTTIIGAAPTSSPAVGGGGSTVARPPQPVDNTKNPTVPLGLPVPFSGAGKVGGSLVPVTIVAVVASLFF